VLAVTITDGDIQVLEHPEPTPGTGQIKVRMRAAGLNASDLNLWRGRPTVGRGSGIGPIIPGLEVAGVVEEMGPGAGRFGIGDRVMAVVNGQAQAEFVVVPEREAMPVPEGLSWIEAGGLPECAMTAHDALFTQCLLSSGERVLINGGAGGVGVVAVQLAAIAGAEVTASVRSQLQRDRVSALGARVVGPEDAHSLAPFDVILELVGAPNMKANLESMAADGRVVVVGTGAGSSFEIDLAVLKKARGRIMGSTLKTRPPERKAECARRLEREALPHFASGRAVVPIEEAFSITKAESAYRRFEAGEKFGKVVIVSSD
jgi:NADPH:quinone reductase